MNKPIQILFIINPISGTVKKSGVEKLIKEHLDADKFNPVIRYTERPHHATEITQSESTKFSIIVAVGGDGTVHEVGLGLIHTNTILGILPMGSGNGLARHLKIPMNTKKAILILNTFKAKKIDTVRINNTHFLGAAGIGFDAHVSNLFAKSTTRGFFTYLKIAVQEFFAYKQKEYKLSYSNTTTERKAFLITFANSNQYGNNAFISPNSIIDDGWFSIIILKKFPLYAAPILALKLFTKKITTSSYIEEIKVQEVEIHTPSTDLHIDGEPIQTISPIIMKIDPLSLNIICNE